MTEISFQLFGKLTIQADGYRIDGLESRRIQELLAYLLLYRDRSHSRESLAELLWDASSTAQSKKYLRQALWQLQQLLPTARLIQADSEWIRISPEITYWLDVEEFARAYAQAEGIPGHQLRKSTANSIDRAAALYRGDLLPGWYADWCLFERERFQNMWLALLDKLMSYCEITGQYEAGLSYGTRALRDDRAHERIHRQMMRLAYLAGDRTSALRQYERCAQALEEELNVKPSRTTEELYQQIREGVADLTRLPQSPRPLGTDTTRMDQLRGMLTQLQQHVTEDLDALENALTNSE